LESAITFYTTANVFRQVLWFPQSIKLAAMMHV